MIFVVVEEVIGDGRTSTCGRGHPRFHSRIRPDDGARLVLGLITLYQQGGINGGDDPRSPNPSGLIRRKTVPSPQPPFAPLLAARCGPAPHGDLPSQGACLTVSPSRGKRQVAQSTEGGAHPGFIGGVRAPAPVGRKCRIQLENVCSSRTAINWSELVANRCVVAAGPWREHGRSRKTPCQRRSAMSRTAFQAAGCPSEVLDGVEEVGRLNTPRFGEFQGLPRDSARCASTSFRVVRPSKSDLM